MKNEDGEVVKTGVSTLGLIKRMWWLTALFTGARKGSIEALRWSDLDLQRKVIHFAVAKGGRTYSIPMSDKLTELISRYKKSEALPDSQWVFPSTVLDGEHLGDVKDARSGVGPAHRLRHSFRTALAELGASQDQSLLLMGHAMPGVSAGYITSSLVIESLRPVANAVATHYVKILGAEL